MKTPFAGIYGDVSDQVANRIHERYHKTLGDRRRLLLGARANHRTQWECLPDADAATWYPVGGAIAEVADGYDQPGELWAVKVSLDMEKAAGIVGYERKLVIDRIMGRTSVWLAGVQFDNLPWHTEDHQALLADMKSKSQSEEELEIILQCDAAVMDEFEPREVTRRLRQYEGLVDHVSVRASRGIASHGDAERLIPYIEAVSETDTAVGVAGGLEAYRVRRYLPALLERFPRLSIEAESQLHQNPDGSHRLNYQKIDAFLEAVDEVVPRQI